MEREKKKKVSFNADGPQVFVFELSYREKCDKRICVAAIDARNDRYKARKQKKQDLILLAEQKIREEAPSVPLIEQQKQSFEDNEDFLFHMYETIVFIEVNR